MGDEYKIDYNVKKKKEWSTLPSCSVRKKVKEILIRLKKTDSKYKGLSVAVITSRLIEEKLTDMGLIKKEEKDIADEFKEELQIKSDVNEEIDSL